MLLGLAVILFVAWLLGLVAFHVTAWTIHIILIIALIVAVFHFMGKRV